jgi:hypothetical protein
MNFFPSPAQKVCFIEIFCLHLQYPSRISDTGQYGSKNCQKFVWYKSAA